VSSINLDKIRKRLHYTERFVPTINVLTELQRNFLLYVPFENLDIHLDIPMDFSESALSNKIIERKRGGLCFENNILFYRLLKQIGFDAQFVGAEMYKNNPTPIVINHMALLVSIKNDTYLVDVGNGKFYGSPIPFNKSTLIKGEDANYLVEDYMGFKLLSFLDQNGQKQPRYAFNPAPKKIKDFIKPSIYTQTSPESIFRQKILVTQFQENGRVTLSDTKLIFTQGGKQKTKELHSPEDYRDILPKLFDIKLEMEQLEVLIHKVEMKKEALKPL